MNKLTESYESVFPRTVLGLEACAVYLETGERGAGEGGREGEMSRFLEMVK